MSHRTYKGEKIEVSGFRGSWSDVKGVRHYSEIQYKWNGISYDRLKDVRSAIDKIKPTKGNVSKEKIHNGHSFTKVKDELGFFYQIRGTYMRPSTIKEAKKLIDNYISTGKWEF